VTVDPNKIGANVGAKIRITPKRSQVFVFTLAIIGGGSLIIGFYFLWKKPNISWVPILIGLALIGASYKAWNDSRENIDLADSAPTTIRCDEHGFEVTTDSRSLLQPNALTIFENFFSIMGRRMPLPDPDGLINSDGTPAPEKRDIAIDLIHKINETTKMSTIEAFALLSGHSQQKEAEQINVQIPLDESAFKGNVGREDLNEDHKAERNIQP